MSRPVPDPALTRVVAWVRQLPVVCGASVAVVGSVVLAGWLLGFEAVTSVGSGSAISTKVNTALMLLGLGAAMILLHRRASRSALVLLAAVATIALTSVLEYVLGADLGIDELFVADPNSATTPGRPAPVTLAAALLASAGLAVQARRGARPAIAGQVLSVPVFALGIVSVAGYLYLTPGLYTLFDNYNAMALLTASCFLALALGMLTLRPTHGMARPLSIDTPPARQARVLLVAALVGPLGFGWVRLQGELQFLYDGRTGLALFATSNVLVFAALVFLTSGSLARTEDRRRAADRALADARRLQQTLLDRSPLVIAAKDLEGRFVVANRSLGEAMGADPGDMIGRRDEDFVDPEAAAAFRRADLEVLESGRAHEVEEVLPGVDGDRVFASVKFPLLSESGEQLGVAVISNDVTDRRRDEEQRLQLQARLARADRMESLGQLAGGVAHDFNNLLGVILNYATLLEPELPEGNAGGGPSARDDLAAIVTAAQRAADLSRQLLTFSRQDVTSSEDTDVHALVRDLVQLLGRTLPENVRLETRLAATTPVVPGAHSRLEQVVMNLVVNARDAMPEGGRLLLETEDAEADGALEGAPRAGRYLRLTISDTGTGMTREVRDRALEPFFTTKPRGSGTGLGLATAYGVVQQLDGKITLYSEPGEGTSVHVHLPVVDERAVATPTVALDDSGATGDTGDTGDTRTATRGETILLVEDERALRVALTRVLTDAGYEVAAVEDAELASAAVSDGCRPDLLLTDVILPGRSGPQLAEELRDSRPDLPVLFASGYTEHALSDSGPAPPFSMIEKPFALDDLLRRIRGLLDAPPS